MNKANEITKDNQNSMNVNVESQTLEYVTNPSKFKEDIEKAKAEIADIFTASKESIHDRGDDNRNFFGQLGEVRLSKTINNIAGEKLEKTDNSEEIARTFEDTYADLGYKNTKVIFTTPENTPQLKDEKGNPKAGTAYVDKETGKRTILINVNDKKNHTKAGLIGTIAEEGSHVINALENRKVETGTDEKGLESTGRATNEYFKNLYSKNDKNITLKSDRQDYLNVDFGENVGDKANEGAYIYKKDLTKEKRKIGGREVSYTKEEIQNNINWWFGTGSFNIDWRKYSNKKQKKYREQANYYYFQAKYSLRVKSVDKIEGNYVTITQKNGEKMVLKKMPANQSIYHNMKYKNGTAYFYFDDRYKKYVQDEGYELILDKNNKPVYNPAIIGTYNFYTYNNINWDAVQHILSDVELWKKYGSGPKDKTTEEMRRKVGDLSFGKFLQDNFDKLQTLATRMKKENFSYDELQDIKKKGVGNYGK